MCRAASFGRAKAVQRVDLDQGNATAPVDALYGHGVRAAIAQTPLFALMRRAITTASASFSQATLCI
jgi:hypothetical protein